MGRGQNQADRLGIGKQGGCSKEKGPREECSGVKNQEIGKLGIVSYRSLRQENTDFDGWPGLYKIIFLQKERGG